MVLGFICSRNLLFQPQLPSDANCDGDDEKKISMSGFNLDKNKKRENFDKTTMNRILT